MSPGDPPGDRQFARRARSRRWAVLRRVAVVVLVLSVLAGAGWLVFVSSVLAVREVRVSGVRTVAPARVAAAAGIPVGVPLARVDVDAVRRRVLNVPVVRRADVGRSWPHTVSIEVNERTPVGAVRAPAGYRLVDASGVMYRTVADPPRRLPVLLVGDDARVTQETAAVAAALPADLVSRISRVQAYTMDSIELVLRDGRTVVWGSAEDSALKAEVLGTLIERKARVYDVSVPGSPTLELGQP